MATNQEARHAAVRSITGTTWTHDGDWMALFTSESIAAGTFNERFIGWLQAATGSASTNINDLKAKYASDNGFASWEAVNTISTLGAASYVLTDAGDRVTTDAGDYIILG